MNTVTIDLNEYNRLRDRDDLLRQLQGKNIVITASTWNGYVTTMFENRDEAFHELTKQLADAKFKLQMTEEKLLKVTPVKKKWF